MKIILITALVLTSAAWGSTDLRVPQGTVSFDATGNPSALHIRGVANAVEGKLTRSKAGLTGSFLVDLAQFDTGLKLRNEHMKKKYLEIEKYPKGEFTVLSVAGIKPDAAIAAGSYDFSGELSLHGVKKPVAGKVSVKDADASGKVPFEASFDVNMKDFGIATPSFAGITVADHVAVKVQAVAE